MKLTENQEKWLSALESEKFKQGYKALRINDNYCCLGVACEILGAKISKKDETSHETLYFYESSGVVLPQTIADQLGLLDLSATISPENRHKFYSYIKSHGYFGELNGSLTAYNDRGATFQQIAKAIRQLPEAVFTS